MSVGQKAKILPRLSAVSDDTALTDCPFVIETADETLETKREIMTKLEEVCSPSAFLTSKTAIIEESYLEPG